MPIPILKTPYISVESTEAPRWMIWKIGGTRQSPAGCSLGTLWEHTWEIIEETAPSNVSRGIYQPCGKGCQQRLIISMHAKQLFAERATELGQPREVFKPMSAKRTFLKGIAVGMQAIGG